MACTLLELLERFPPSSMHTAHALSHLPFPPPPITNAVSNSSYLCFHLLQQFECHQYWDECFDGEYKRSLVRCSRPDPAFKVSACALTNVFTAHTMSTRSLTLVEMVSRSSSVNSGLLPSRSISRGPSSKPDANFKRFVYTYNMLAAQTPMQFYISFVLSAH